MSLSVRGRLSRMRGFTMIELLVVIAVIGVLAVAVLSSINPIEQINKGRDTRLRSNAAQLLSAFDRYYSLNENYPWNETAYGGTADELPSVQFPSYTGNTACGFVSAETGNNNYPTGFCQIGGTGYTPTLPANRATSWIWSLSSTDEVKDSFINQIENRDGGNSLFIRKGDTTSTFPDPSVCFLPRSKQFQKEAVEACATRNDVLPTGACPQGNATAYTGLTVDDWDGELICLP